MQTLSVQLLGGFQLRYGDGVVDLSRSERQQALLAYLTLHGDQPLSRQRIAFLFWPDSTESQARANLRKLLYKVRQAVPDADDLLDIGDHTVGWAAGADIRVDVRNFEMTVAKAQATADPGRRAELLQAALDRYAGELLPGFYEEWILEKREEVHRLAGTALEDLVHVLEDQRRYGEALAYAERLRRHDRLREAPYRALMRLHALQGEPERALNVYHRCASTLESELGVEPGMATHALYQQLLSQEDEAVSPISVPGLPRFVGREPEWRMLRQVWRALTAGEAQLVLISGEAGVGKTRLAEEWRQWLERQGVATAKVQCYAAGRDVAYLSLTELLRARPLPPLDKGSLEELARLLPELLETHPELAPPDAAPEKESRLRLYEAIHKAIVAEAPALLLFLDDIHCCDRETLSWVQYLLRAGRAKVEVVGTYLPGEIEGGAHPVWQLQTAASRAGQLTQIELSPLDPAETEALVKAIVGRETLDPELHSIRRESEGNPLFIVEMVRSRQDLLVNGRRREGRPERGILPERLRLLLEARLARLSPPVREIVEVAAVIGREFSFDLLAPASGTERALLLNALDELWRRRIIREQEDDSYDFSHGSLRKVILENVSPPRRRLLHGRVAAALEDQLAPKDRADVAGRLAHHHTEAGNVAQAITYLLQAGDRARRLYALEEAAHFYREAVEGLKAAGEQERAARALMKLGLTQHQAFAFPEAEEVYREGFALWRQAASRHRSARAAPHPLKMHFSDPGTLDPASSFERIAAPVIAQLFSGLVTLTPRGNAVPDAAQRWEIQEGGRVYVFRLRRDLRWSDGKRVTAGDFRFAWRRVLDPSTASTVAHFLYDIKGARAFHEGEVTSPDGLGVRARDAHTLVVGLEAPAGYFLPLLAHTAFSPVPRHVVERHGAAWADAENIVSNGPFRLVEWIPDEVMRFRRHDGYHGLFRGNVAEVVLEPYPMDQLEVALRRYEADEIATLGLLLFPPARQKEILRRHADEYVTGSWLDTVYIGFCTSRPPFDDPLVRRAVALATDREMLAYGVMDGRESPGTGGFVPPEMPGHVVGIAPPYDLERARRLLAEAGYPGGRGLPQVEALASGDTGLAPFPDYLQKMAWLQDLGVDVRWEILDVEAFYERILRDPPHLYVEAFGADYLDPDSFLRTSPISSHTGWRHSGYEELVEAGRHTVDQEQRLLLYEEAQRILAAEVPILPLTYGRWHRLVKPWLRGYTFNPFTLWRWQDITIEPH